jgi:hypothetical protein
MIPRTEEKIVRCEICMSGYWKGEPHVCKKDEYPKRRIHYDREYEGYIIPCHYCDNDTFRKRICPIVICTFCAKLRSAKQRIAVKQKSSPQ